MSAYTPGPWTVGTLVHEIRGPRGELLAELASLGERYTETAPNAHLMAAAPTLAQLLARARDELADLNQSENDGGAFLAEIDSALLAAEGRP